MNSFKNAKSPILGAGTNIYTVPAATQAVIHSIYISNVSGIDTKHVTIKIGNIRLISNKAILVNDCITLDKPFNLITGETLVILADDGDNTIEAFVSLMEIT